MSKLTVYMTEKNYVSIDDIHIFINFNRQNLDMLNEMDIETIRVIYVFVTSHTSINESLKILVERFGGGFGKIIEINIPEPIRELEELCEKFLGNELYLRIIIDSPIFFPTKISGELNDHLLVITPTKDCITIAINPYNVTGVELNFPRYPYNSTDDEEGGIFENMGMRLDPWKFKDKLIAAFKERCPEGILKSFKSDDDIMGYILQTGEWEVKEGDINHDTPK